MMALARSVLLALSLNWGMAQAGEVSVAVASNFAGTMKEIVSAFEAQTGHKVAMTPGATGKFYAQISNGAPFGIFLSADDETPARLEKEGRIVPGTRFTYATGRLVLWSRKETLVLSQGSVLKTGDFRFIAMANPKLAPYGQAALQTLQKLGVLTQLEPKIVQGENIAQVHQFVDSGNADLGFVALSQVWYQGKITSGAGWIVPESFHDPLRQDAVLLEAGKNSDAARALMNFLKSDKAKEIMAAYGYRH